MYSCTEEALEAERNIAFEQYFDRFEEEGLKRGVDVDLYDIGARFEVTDQTAVGQCITLTSGYQELRIDESYWQEANEDKKEFLIFHELGHCFLKRNHLDDKTNGGLCFSMMTSGTGTCNILYNQDTREKYLDELFLNS